MQCVSVSVQLQRCSVFSPVQWCSCVAGRPDAERPCSRSRPSPSVVRGRSAVCCGTVSSQARRGDGRGGRHTVHRAGTVPHTQAGRSLPAGEAAHLHEQCTRHGTAAHARRRTLHPAIEGARRSHQPGCAGPAAGRRRRTVADSGRQWPTVGDSGRQWVTVADSYDTRCDTDVRSCRTSRPAHTLWVRRSADRPALVILLLSCIDRVYKCLQLSTKSNAAKEMPLSMEVVSHYSIRNQSTQLSDKE